MDQTDIAEPDSLERAATLASKSFDIIFDDAPVMMHAIDRDGKLIKVNRQWLDTLGYEDHEVLGHKSVEFLTDQAQVRAIRETLPLFWLVGEAKSIGYEFVCKNGRILDVLLDAQVVNTVGGDSYTVAALYGRESVVQWEEASTTIRVLMQLAHMQYQVEQSVGSEDPDRSNSDPPPWLPKVSSQPAPSADVLGPLLEATLNVSSGLRALVTQQEHWLETTEEHQLELVRIAKSIDRTLAELAGTAAAIAAPFTEPAQIC